MPLPLILIGGAVLAGALGVKKTADAHSMRKDAQQVHVDTQRKLQEAQRKVEVQRQKTSQEIKKLGRTKVQILATTVNQFVRDFSQLKEIDLKNSQGIRELQRIYGVNMSPANLQRYLQNDLQKDSQKLNSIIESGLTGLGGGAIMAFGAYGVAGIVGTASTGAAIAELSGVAASNATLAWLGGGTLATGGFGVLGGMTVLGGLIAGPALLIFGGLSSSRARTALNNAYSEAAQAKVACEKQTNIVSELKNISQRAEDLQRLLTRLNLHFSGQVNQMHRIIRWKGTSWDDYDEREKQAIGKCMITALGIKKVIDTSLLTKSGALDPGVEKSLRAGKKLLSLTW